jgi:hypothetical protein
MHDDIDGVGFFGGDDDDGPGGFFERVSS